MALETNTVQEVYDNLVAQLQSEFGTFFPKSFALVLSKALAAIFILLYKYCGFIFLQMFVSTASMEETEINGKTITPLIEWGRLIGVGDPTPATQAELIIEMVTEDASVTLPVGVQWVHVASGITFLSLESVALTSATVQVAVIAASDPNGTAGSGTQGNLVAGTELSLANPLAGVNRTATVVSQSVTGAEKETNENYRKRVVARFQQKPQGGAYVDYKIWGEGVSGILNVYPYTSTSPGRVDVYVESATETDGIPTSAQLTSVLAAINYDDNGLASRRPANALVTALAITRLSFDVEIEGLDVDNLAQVKTDIEDALTSYFLAKEPYIVGLSIPPRKDRITQAAISGVVDDVVSEAGGVFTDIVVNLSASPITLYSLGIGEKAKLGGVTYT